MMEASFDRMRSAAISSAYQYDTGQRLRLHGLPSPQELAGRDDFLSGDLVSVQAHYSYAGESQTEARIAVWDGEARVWTAAVPDAYLLRNEDVHVYVYVGYGQTEESMRAKTMYEAVFRPIARPAPGTSVTPDQTNAWDALVQEVNLAITSANTAASNANAAATQAKETGAKFDAMQVAAVTLPAGSDAIAEIEDKGSYKKITFGIPKGEQGEKGSASAVTVNGKEADTDGEIVLKPEDIGALAAAETVCVEMALDGFTAGEDGWYAQTIAADGILESDNPVADVITEGLTAAQALNAQEIWSTVAQIATGDGEITVYCTENPSGFADMLSVSIRLLVFR